MKLSQRTRGFTLIEVIFTTVIISVVGLVVYSLLNINTILGAKNTAVNTAHQQARVAMLQMVQDLRSAVSLPALANASGVPYASPAPAAAEGISFQQWAAREGGPHKILANVDSGDTMVRIIVTAGPGATVTQSRPKVGQRLIVPTHQIEGDITAVSGTNSDYRLTLGNIQGPPLGVQEATAAGLPFPVVYPVNRLPVDIKGTDSTVGDVVCFVTDRCWYSVSNGGLNWHRQGDRVIVNDITNSAPFGTPTTPAGALYYRFVAAIDLSTSDLDYTNRGFKSANVLLNGQVPMKVRLTTYQ